MAGKTSLHFILNPAEAPVTGLLELHKAAVAHNLLLPSLQSPPRVGTLPAFGNLCQPLHVEEKRFVAILPKTLAAKPTNMVAPTFSTDGESADDEDDTDEGDQHHHSHTPTRLKSSKKKTRLCKEPGCTSLAVSRNSCVRHGGGSRCVVSGCNNGAKLRNRCFQHGGSTVCLAEGCDSKAKRYGYCWSHGGGRICSEEGCNKVAAQGGLCWAHGGGNRCKLEGCTKRSYQKHGYYCKRHAMYNTEAMSS